MQFIPDWNMIKLVLLLMAVCLCTHCMDQMIISYWLKVVMALNIIFNMFKFRKQINYLLYNLFELSVIK